MLPSVKSSVLYESRYCNQDEFDISVFRGKCRYESTNEVITINCPDFKTSVENSLISAHMQSRKTIFIGSDAYLLYENYQYTFNVYSKIKKLSES